MKNILVLVGSARKNGNTSTLADAFTRGATEAGHTVNKVQIGSMDIRGCRGCQACRFGKPCVIQDDMADIYPLYEKCDMVVLASPLYYWTVTSSIKAFIERLYATAEQDSNPPKGRYEKYAQKEAALLMTAEDDLFWTFEQAVSYYRFAFINYLGWQDKGMVLAGGCAPRDRQPLEDLGHMEKAYQFGRGL